MTIHYQFCTWQSHQQALMSIRSVVFIEEQNVPVELEIDEYDPKCIHILALDEQKPIATARLLKDGHIGRMCVLKEYRLQGIATQMLKRFIQTAEQKHIKTLTLHAQISAIPFYQKSGFGICSDIFLDAGIEHKTMQLELTPTALDNSKFTIELDGKAQCRETVARLISQATKNVAIFTQTLEYSLYHQSVICDALKTLVLKNKKARVRIICKESRAATQHGHCFIDLAQKLSSFIEIRKPNTKEINQFQQSWLIIDDIAYCHIKNLERFKGSASNNEKRITKESLDFFNHAWDNSEIDQNTRRLSL